MKKNTRITEIQNTTETAAHISWPTLVGVASVPDILKIQLLNPAVENYKLITFPSIKFLI
jgi:hypothetical protein